MLDPKIREIISECSLNTGASNEALASVESIIGRTLPHDYVDLLQFSNGFEGMVGHDGPGSRKDYVCFWPVEMLLEYNEAYKVAEFAPGLFLFGSNGGTTAYAFDMRENNMSIVAIDFITLCSDELIVVRSNLIKFFRFLTSP